MSTLSIPHQGPACIKPLVTPAEREVWRLVALGRSTKDIARELSKAVKTVDSQRVALNRKLNVHNAADLTRMAVQYGIIEVPVEAAS